MSSEDGPKEAQHTSICNCIFQYIFDTYEMSSDIQVVFTVRESLIRFCLILQGETSAGKSSMLNLILGEELLPFSVLSTTSTICELKYGRKERINIHYKEERKEPKVKYLDESCPYMDQISEFVHLKSASLREKASDYKKVELFWPHRLLKVRYLMATFNCNDEKIK